MFMKTRWILIGMFSISLLIPIRSSYAGAAHGYSTSSGALATAGSSKLGLIRGEVHFDGPALKPTRINMAADPSCGAHSGAIFTDDFVMAPDGKLANVLVFISDGLGSEQFTTPAEPVVMQQKGCMYKPRVVALQTNQKLRIMNSDSTLHNIHPTPQNNREWNKAQPGGSSIEDSFAREEIAIPVKCNVHPWMKSYISVFKHPYFSVTLKDGKFELPNLPPGQYTLEAWHERLGTIKQKISVSSGEVTTVDLTFKSAAAR
ncbi:MAG: hypothetical protein JO266_02000 [Acidobacteria bacterium]|nr:hypothetical protein [Acidobacteriota bacterium]MBV8890741.1 hypothetical protein [Acidobacteriota bacterium]